MFSSVVTQLLFSTTATQLHGWNAWKARRATQRARRRETCPQVARLRGELTRNPELKDVIIAKAYAAGFTDALATAADCECEDKKIQHLMMLAAMITSVGTTMLVIFYLASL